MNKLLLFSLVLIMFSCSPAVYKSESNPVGKALLDGTTKLTLINKSKDAVNFYIVNIDAPDEEITVEVIAKSEVVITDFDCGRYDIFVKDQLLKSTLIRPKFKNKLTYEIKRQ